MNKVLQSMAHQLTTAAIPEEVFGVLPGNQTEWQVGLKSAYHQMAKVAHPDAYRSPEDIALAELTFSQLTEWFVWAEEKLAAGTYGASAKVVGIRLHTRTREYVLDGSYTTGDFYNEYPSRYLEAGQTHRAVLKIARDPAQNDLLYNEARMLHILSSAENAKRFAPYLPAILDSFVYPDGAVTRQVNVFEPLSGWTSLAGVMRAYPAGVDPKDMAWIWRRLLIMLGFAHTTGLIHGAVLPEHVWILPGEHGLLLADWYYAVDHPEETGGRIAFIDPHYETWYPPEALNHEALTPGMDIYMAAKCMAALLGGDPVRGVYPPGVPAPIRAFLKGSMLAGKRARPQDAWALKEEFDDLIGRLWGERKFHPFTMN